MIAITHTSVLVVLDSDPGPWTVREIAETLRCGAPSEHYFYAVKRRLEEMVDNGTVERFYRLGSRGAHCYAMAKGNEP